MLGSNKQKGISAVSAVSLVSLAAAALAAPAHAADVDTISLEQRVLILERQLEIQKEEADAKAKDATTSSAGEKGFGLKKGDYELKFNLLAQVDHRIFLNDPAGQNFKEGFVLRRLRPTFQGSLGKVVGFRLTPEFAGNGAGLGTAPGAGAAPTTATVNSAASIVDAYFDLKFAPYASVRVGKQKGPIGIERLQSGGAISFIERGFPTELVPNRDIGAQLYGEVLNGTLNYAIGAFNGTRDGRDIDTTDGDNRREIEGRIFAEPFKNSPGLLQGLGFGVAGSQGTVLGSTTAPTVPQFRTPGQNAFFSFAATTFANGEHQRWSPQAYWYYNSFGVLAEYAASRQAFTNGTTNRDITNRAYEVTATYVLTGEDATFKGPIKPKKSYTIGGEGWGAFEVAARTGELHVDHAAFDGPSALATAGVNAQQKAVSYGLGVNWYVNQNAKVVLDYDYTRFGSYSGSAAQRPDEKALFTRLQITY